jgi:hypothetical protein
MAIFPAKEARKQASGLREIFNEIALIEPAILDAIEAGAFEVKVGPISSVTTGMSNSEVHFDAYVNPQATQDDASQVARTQIYGVIRHFVELGYVVRIEKHTVGDVFNWVIKW